MVERSVIAQSVQLVNIFIEMLCLYSVSPAALKVNVYYIVYFDRLDEQDSQISDNFCQIWIILNP